MSENLLEMEIKIELLKTNKKAVPLSLISNIYIKTQNIFNLIGQWLLFQNELSTGVFPKEVKHHFTLAVVDVKIASYRGIIKLINQYGSVDDENKGKEGFLIFNKLLDALNDPTISFKDIQPLIQDRSRHNLIMRDFIDMAPSKNDNHRVSITSDSVKRDFTPKTKEKAKALMYPPIEPFSFKELGRISIVDVDHKRFYIETKEKRQKCVYNSKFEDTILQNIGKLVEVNGIMREDEKYIETCYVSNPDNINEKQHVPFNNFQYQGEKIPFTKPILLDFNHTDGYYILSNDTYPLSGKDKTFRLAYDKIQKNMHNLWHTYVDVDSDRKLTIKEWEIRKLLLKLTK